MIYYCLTNKTMSKDENFNSGDDAQTNDSESTTPDYPVDVNDAGTNY
jgi:hypothetical protein